MIEIDFMGVKIHQDKPELIIVAEELNQVIPALKEIEVLWKKGYYAVGYLSYEAAPAFDINLRVYHMNKMPLLWFAMFQQPTSPLIQQMGDFSVSTWKPNCSKEEYRQAIKAIHQAIERGDTYQVNHTIRLRADFQGDAYAFYQQLSALQSGYNAYLDIGRFQLLSVSPELFFHWKHLTLRTRPMKGTAKRGRWLTEDHLRARGLAESSKNLAENLMIVDLLRNDLGKIAVPSTVQVPSLFTVERYPTVWQMTSTIEATIQPKTTLVHILKALFPCGSITGAPKRKTMELISSLEQSAREAYCGTIGYLKPNDEAAFNVAIRTVVIDRKEATAEYGVGGGITWDSTSIGEYEEVTTKAQILTTRPKNFQLLESIRLENGSYTLRERHFHRLRESAEYFDFLFPQEEIEQKLSDLAKQYPLGIFKVRMLLSVTGEVELEVQELQKLQEPIQIAIAKKPISSDQIFLYHKTTQRQMYEQHRIAGAFDTILWNEREELTEFTIGNVVLELDGKKVTPPRESGLLAGTLRAELLEQGEIEELVLSKKDLRRATAIWLVNSVRGWVKVEKV